MIIRLTIGGCGEVTRLFKEIKELGIVDSVRYCGWISDKERDLLLRKTDIFVLPSYAEGMPMSILEAMAYSVPVVVTPVGGVPEIVLDGETGLLVMPGDLDALCEKIALLIENVEYRNKLEYKRSLLVRRKHNMDLTVKKINAIYNSL